MYRYSLGLDFYRLNFLNQGLLVEDNKITRPLVLPKITEEQSKSKRKNIFGPKYDENSGESPHHSAA